MTFPGLNIGMDETVVSSNYNNQGYPHAVYGWYVAVVLLIANITAFIDRMILSLLVEPIKADLGFTDTQIGLLQGFVFSIFYASVGLPLGRMADYMNRRNIITAGICFWSVMTACCGLARNFLTFFLARMGVGIGEATLGSSGYSLISDYFPKNRRSKPISLLAMGPYLGGGLSFLVGSLVISLIAGYGYQSLPLVGPLKPWQLTFIIVGLPGVLVGLLVLFTVKEPVRHDRITDRSAETKVLPWSATFSYIWSHRVVYGLLTIGTSFNAAIGYAFNSWTPAMVMRVFDWQATEIGFAYGWVLLVFGGGGTFVGGMWADWLGNRGHKDAYMRMMAIASVMLVLFILVGLLPSPYLMLVFVAIALFFLGSMVGVAMAAITQVTPNEFRGQVLALYLFVLIGIGAGLGPFGVAFISDYIIADPSRLNHSLSLFAAIFVPVPITCFWLCLRTYRKTVETLKH